MGQIEKRKSGQRGRRKVVNTILNGEPNFNQSFGNTKTVLGNTEDTKVAWGLLEKRYSAKQQGLQSVLMEKLQLAKWNDNGSVHTHRDTMVDIRTELADTGMTINALTRGA
jgi:gag-polypeptide of LTR copia-type